MKSKFKAAWWLKNPHLQTIFPRLLRSNIKLQVRRERIELPDGDFIDLDWTKNSQGPIVIVLHGLGGSIDSPYAKGIMAAIDNQNWRGVIMHFRGCSGEMNRLPRSYHSGETTDLSYVVNLIKNRFPDTPLYGVGFSLGGNVLLKWLGETGSLNPLKRAVAVSVPFELNKAADHLDQNFSRFYQWWLLQQLKNSTLEKFKNIPAPINLSKVKKSRNFWEFDDYVTAPLHGFLNVQDYYQQSSSRQFIHKIKIPTLIIHALDDPFISPSAIPSATELPPNVTLELSKTGGHVGFISGKKFGKAEYWLDKRIIEYFEEK